VKQTISNLHHVLTEFGTGAWLRSIDESTWGVEDKVELFALEKLQDFVQVIISLVVVLFTYVCPFFDFKQRVEATRPQGQSFLRVLTRLNECTCSLDAAAGCCT
jgi:hypothetical protein